MPLGGSFSLTVSRSGLEVKLLVFIIVIFSRLGGCTLSLVNCHSIQNPGCYSRGCRSGLVFG